MMFINTWVKDRDIYMTISWIMKRDLIDVSILVNKQKDKTSSQILI